MAEQSGDDKYIKCKTNNLFDILPDNVIDTIHKYKHQMEFKKCLDDINIINSEEYDFWINGNFEYDTYDDIDDLVGDSLYELLYYTFYKTSCKRRHIQQTHCLLIDIEDCFKYSLEYHICNDASFLKNYINLLANDILTCPCDYIEGVFIFNKITNNHLLDYYTHIYIERTE